MDIRSRPRAMGVVVDSVSPEELYEVIVGASSQDFARMQASTQRLKQMLEMFGAYDALQDIASRKEIPVEIRQQAMIQFKNVVTNHWRSRKLLSDEHRARIRERSLLFVDEEVESIAECNELVVVKLARTDFPNQWPNLIPDLIRIIDDNLKKRYVSMVDDPRDTLRLRRSLELLNGILKEFASIKMPSGLKVMAQIVEQLQDLLYGYYSTMSSNFSLVILTPQTINSQTVYDNILLAHLVYKCLVKMSTWLWNKFAKLSPEELRRSMAWVEKLFNASTSQLKALTEIRKGIMLSLLQNESVADPQSQKTLSVLTRHVKTFGKFFRRLQQLAPDRFVQFSASGDLILFYWAQVVDSTNYPAHFVADSDDSLFPVRFLVQAMVLFKESLSQFTPVRRSGVPNANVLSKDFVENAVRLLVTRFMPLNAADLQSWVEDPEEWVQLEDKENDQWEFEIRACAERVLMQICNQFPDFVVPLLVSWFVEIAPKPTVELEAIVQKEALYCAIGRCATRLKTAMDFETYVGGTFASEVRETNPSYAIIKRRIAWLLGKWVAECCTKPNDPKIWEILAFLVQDHGPGTDSVVRLTSVSALRECADVVEFDADNFAPYLATVVPHLIKIMAEADTLESKRKVDESLNIIIEQSGMRILPFMNVITEPIPQLWMSSEDDYLFKASLLVTVTKVVEAVKENSSTLGHLVVPLIRESLAPSVIVQLDTDALNLWTSALRNTVAVTSADGRDCLRDLVPDAINLLGNNFDVTGVVSIILESYFLLDAAYILEKYATDLFKAYLNALAHKALGLNAKGLIQSISLVIQLGQSTFWGEALHTSGLFPHLLKTMIAGEVDEVLLTEHIYLFSRIIMADRRMFLQLVSAASPVLNQPETVLYDFLMDQWMGKFDHMCEPRHRKLTAMGLAAFVSTARPEVLNRVPVEAFNIFTDVFGDIREAQEQAATAPQDEEPPSPTSLRRFWDLDKAPESYFRNSEGTPEYKRREALYQRDPIRSIALVPYVAECLREAENACGSANFQHILNRTDPAVLKQIQDAIARGG
ncbi:ARM repeat-containing protein [Agrocybe pediades]|nr:ARM repeat-containing protein [Agrocybe pediades]